MKNNKIIISAAIIIAVIIGLTLYSGYRKPNELSRVNLSQPQLTKLAIIPDDYYNAMKIKGKNIDNIAFSSDFSKVAFVVASSTATGNKYSVFVNNEVGLWYDSVGFNGSNPEFTPDGKLIYFSSKGDDSLLMIDGLEKYKTDKTEAIVDLIFNQDRQKFALETLDNNSKSHIVFNGIESRGYDMITNDVISPDGTSIAYYGCMNGTYSRGGDGQCNLIVQDQQGKITEDSGLLGTGILARSKFMEGFISWSPDGKELVYKDNGQLVINGERIWSPAEGAFSASNITFSPDSKSLAYVASSTGKQYVVVNGEIRGEYDGEYGLYFSPDSKKIAYWAKKGSNWFIVVNGSEYPVNYSEFSEPTSIIFTPDYSDFAYTFRNKDWSDEYIVHGNRIIGEYFDISYPSFVANNKLVFVASDEGYKNQRVVIDGQERKPHDLIVLFPERNYSDWDYLSPYYSTQDYHYRLTPDGKGIQYGAVDGQNIYSVTESF